jgi:hypothetical protein
MPSKADWSELAGDEQGESSRSSASMSESTIDREEARDWARSGGELALECDLDEQLGEGGTGWCCCCWLDVQRFKML